MEQIGVLIVDDAVAVRMLLSELLSRDPALKIVGRAANGREALDKIARIAPDVVVLDIEMPQLNGLETLAALRMSHPRLPVIMLSILTQRAAAATVDALLLGADDYVAKPSSDTGKTLQHCIEEELIPKIKALCGKAPARTPPLRRPRSSPRPARVIAIGTSTGGPNALAQLVAGFPRDLSAPVLIVQHMPKPFIPLLAARLAGVGALEVRVAESGDRLISGRLYLAPGERHMRVEQDELGPWIGLEKGAPINGCCPAVDPLFESVAQVFGASSLGVVLTGMGTDGLAGSRAIDAAGGEILVQDRASSVAWSMPRAVLEAELASDTVALEQMSGEIVRRVARRG